MKKKKKGGGSCAPPPIVELGRRLEVDRRADEQVTTKCVINLRVGVAVAERSSNRSGAKRRILVEHVVRTDTDVPVIRHVVGRRDVDIVPGFQRMLPVERIDGHAVRSEE